MEFKKLLFKKSMSCGCDGYCKYPLLHYLEEREKEKMKTKQKKNFNVPYYTPVVLFVLLMLLCMYVFINCSGKSITHIENKSVVEEQARTQPIECVVVISGHDFVCTPLDNPNCWFEVISGVETLVCQEGM